MNEVIKHKPKISKKDFIKSGFTIGKDVIGTMLNTLVLAYVGTSLSLVLLLSEFGGLTFSGFLNFGYLAEEILRAIIGVFGLLAAIPITVLVAGLFFDRGKRKLNIRRRLFLK